MKCPSAPPEAQERHLRSGLPASDGYLADEDDSPGRPASGAYGIMWVVGSNPTRVSVFNDPIMGAKAP